MNKVFEIQDLRDLIFSFVYPKQIKKGMKVIVVKSRYDPYLTNRCDIIDSIIINKKNEFVITFLKQERYDNNLWYKVYTHLYPNKGDIIKVVNSKQLLKPTLDLLDD
tara:strand:+ start:308 stop:628 length:321 start_codon:yes stop_codon:yes gene_type:complete